MMKKEKAIIVKNVKKKYTLYNNSKERLLDVILPKKYGEEFYALSGINFEANMGEVVGFVGINGSGKSTLSNIIAGIVPETTGTIETNGQVALIAVAAGLKGDLTGRENIELKLLMLGFNKQEIKELEEEIIEFSELGKFIDQPVKSYSSGMKSRLGFSISVTVDPDILIIDEALSVGDKAFAEKSLDKMKEFKAQGKTMIFVSHSIGQMKRFCDKILWLEFGTVKDYGAVEKIMPKYEDFLEKWKQFTKGEREIYRKNALMNNDKENEKLLAQKIGKKKKSGHSRLIPISRMARLTKSNDFLYPSISELHNHKPLETYKNEAFYIKKTIKIEGQQYYLLSTKPSAVDGIVGWVRSSAIQSASHIFIEEDKKIFTLNGTGKAYNRPWGLEKNIVYDDLTNYKNEKFYVKRTDRVRGRLWYYGSLNDVDVWIFGRNLIKK